MEFGAVQVEVFKSLESGNAALKNLQNQLSLEDAERIMDENAENLAYVDELSDIVSQNLSEEDNAELEEELAALGESAESNQGLVNHVCNDGDDGSELSFVCFRCKQRYQPCPQCQMSQSCLLSLHMTFQLQRKHNSECWLKTDHMEFWRDHGTVSNQHL